MPSVLFNNFENLNANSDTAVSQLKEYLIQTDSQIILTILKKVASDRENQFFPIWAKSLEWNGFQSDPNRRLFLSTQADAARKL